jgi:hypothetical protein
MKVHSERINPEVVEKFGVANGDMTGDTLDEPVVSEQTKRSS